jgi:uncharacterized membrane protein YgdD (TMEM256/DUF423 family)
MERVFFSVGSVSALLAVAAGAFAAHGLKARLTPELIAVFETAVRYQLAHALALLAVAWASSRWPGRATLFAGWAFVVGTVLFSGSLYALALTGARTFGAITPFGGVVFIAGWGCLAWAAARGGRGPAGRDH